MKANHRYYLHRMIKKFARVSAYKKEVEVTEKLLAEISEKQIEYIKELKSIGYNIQYVIV